MRDVTLYFDFISPYSYIAIAEIASHGPPPGARLTYAPVVYGAILTATGLIGPAENEAKRQYMFLDVMRRAERLGIPFEGPPAHPFRTLKALRAVCVFLDRPEAPRLVEQLAHACWGEGADLTDLAVLQRVVADVGLDASDLGSRIADPTVKHQLTDLTRRAMQRGVFGVPTFDLDGELFWGHDRMDDLADRLAGRPAPPAEHVARLIDRPRGIDRRR